MADQNFITKSKELSRKEKQRFYSRAAWKRIRRRVFKENPLCQECLKWGRLAPASVCDHISPIWNTWEGFIKGPFQALCKPCHREKLERDITAKRKARLFEVREHA